MQAPRGVIFDRWGQRLAMSLPSASVCVDPLRVPDKAMAATILSQILNMDAKDLQEKMQSAADDKNGFLWIKRKITPDEAARLRALQSKMDWIELRTESQRFYPSKSLAAHVIGSVDFQQKGNAGIEQSLNEELKGRAGEIRVIHDVQKRGFESKVVKEPHKISSRKYLLLCEGIPSTSLYDGITVRICPSFTATSNGFRKYSRTTRSE